jgi:hypothetical protein
MDTTQTNLANRLELQELSNIDISARLSALEESFDHCNPQAADDRVERLHAKRNEFEGYRNAIGKLYEKIDR